MNNEISGRQDPRFHQVDSVQEYFKTDLARTHRATARERGVDIALEVFEAQHEQLLRDGYIVLTDMVSSQQLLALRTQADKHLQHVGRNSFEGERTQRIYGLPEKLRSADVFIEHPLVLAHLDRLLKPNYLLSQAQVINIKTDSPAQPLHIDDAFYLVPRPRPAIGVATVFAIDEFTADNGATVVIPGSHRWEEDRTPTPDDERIKAVMPAGACILFLGNVWHGGGENVSGSDRLALTCQYCEPWARTQENYFLSVSRETAASVSEDMRRMLGYSIYPPFMGMVNGMHPKRCLPGAD